MITGKDVIDTARSYLGVRFRKTGRNRAGLDCVGLLYVVAQDLGIEVEDYQQYRMDISASPILQKYVLDQCVEVDRHLLPHGSIVLLRQSVYPLHSGFIAKDTGQITVIDANMGKRRVIEESFQNWSDMVVKVLSYKGVDLCS